MIFLSQHPSNRCTLSSGAETVQRVEIPGGVEAQEAKLTDLESIFSSKEEIYVLHFHMIFNHTNFVG